MFLSNISYHLSTVCIAWDFDFLLILARSWIDFHSIWNDKWRQMNYLGIPRIDVSLYLNMFLSKKVILYNSYINYHFLRKKHIVWSICLQSILFHSQKCLSSISYCLLKQLLNCCILHIDESCYFQKFLDCKKCN
jgi:hypothetical protein